LKDYLPIRAIALTITTMVVAAIMVFQMCCGTTPSQGCDLAVTISQATLQSACDSDLLSDPEVHHTVCEVAENASLAYLLCDLLPSQQEEVVSTCDQICERQAKE
jgi:hypothetical protein